MKKTLMLLLTAALVIGFAACTRKVGSNIEITGEPLTGKNGEQLTFSHEEIVTDDKGVVVTDVVTEVVTNDDGSAMTAADGKEITTAFYDFRTTVWSEYLTIAPPPTDNDGNTFPPTEKAADETYPTTPEGNTLASQNEDWPEYEFISKVPKIADKVDAVFYSPDKGDGHETLTVRINDMSYEDYKAYIKKCTAAGFKESRDFTVPDKEPKESFLFYSTDNGVWMGVTYYADKAPYRYCDVQLTVSNYNPVEPTTKAADSATTAKANTASTTAKATAKAAASTTASGEKVSGAVAPKTSAATTKKAG